MRDTVAILLLVLGSGCTSPQTTSRAPSGAPTVILVDHRREDDPRFSADERALISRAKHFLERRSHTKLDAYYKVERTADGYEVYIERISGYEGSQPLSAPGSGSIIELRNDGSFIRYLPGE